MTPVVITFERPEKWLNANDRRHWATRARSVRNWRRCAEMYARQADVANRITGPSTVAIALTFATRRTRDAHNWGPTLKACIDGLVDAGAWPDDCTDWVRTLEPELLVDKARPNWVTITITPKGTE